MNRGVKDETRIRHCEEQLQADNAYTRAMDEALAADPPVIEWERRAGGVLIAISIRDPHTVKPNKIKKAS